MGGSKGSTTTTTSQTQTFTAEPDKEYNARMAAVAEKQLGLSSEYFDFWKQVQSPVEKATAEAQMSLIPQQTANALEGLNAFAGTQRQFYNMIQPTSEEVYAGRATTDATRALSQSNDTLARNQARMGISPNSGASLSAQRDNAITGAASIAGAANTGRLMGRQTNLQNLSAGMQYGSQL